MRIRRNGLGLRLTAAAVGSVLALLVTGCTSHQPGRSAAAATAGRSATPSSASLAPAGPAPGEASGAPGEDEEPGPSLDLARSIGCADIEEQESLPSVGQQLTCRRGVDRIYVMTFATSADRDVYLGQDQPVVPGGWNVIGPTWVIHTDVSAAAQELMHQLGGSVSAGA